MPDLRISAVLLAAGLSTRMGQQKALLPWQGRTLLESQIAAMLEAGVCEVIVVLGYHAERLRPLAEAFPRTKTALNLRYKTGRSSSLRVGMRRVDPASEAILVLSVDQPRRPDTMRRVMAAHAEGRSLITYPSYQGKGGHPIVCSASLLPELLRVRESRQGLHEVVERHRAEVCKVELDDPQVVVDLNRPEDYQSAIA